MSSLTLNDMQNSRRKTQINTYGIKDKYPRLEGESVGWVAWLAWLFFSPEPAGGPGWSGTHPGAGLPLPCAHQMPDPPWHAFS